MDFETVNPAIPRFPGMRPYDQLPFQWSVHVLRQPGAEPEHHEFLATDTTILGASSSLRYALSSARAEASSCTAPSSRSDFRSLQPGCPSSRSPSRKSSGVSGTCSLWSANHVYHPAFAGSFSLKNVLPALVPEMTYEGMEVADGRTPGWLGRRSYGAAWISGDRAPDDKGGPAGLLRAGHAGHWSG